MLPDRSARPPAERFVDYGSGPGTRLRVGTAPRASQARHMPKVVAEFGALFTATADYAVPVARPWPLTPQEAVWRACTFWPDVATAALAESRHLMQPWFRAARRSRLRSAPGALRTCGHQCESDQPSGPRDRHWPGRLCPQVVGVRSPGVRHRREQPAQGRHHHGRHLVGMVPHGPAHAEPAPARAAGWPIASCRAPGSFTRSKSRRLRGQRFSTPCCSWSPARSPSCSTACVRSQAG